MTYPQTLQTPTDAELHPQAKAAGETAGSVAEADDEASWPPLFNCMKGDIWLDPDYDFTRPTFLDWAREIDDK